MKNRSAPVASIVPMLMYEDVSGAIEWLSRVLGFRESLRYVASDGRVTHAQMTFSEHEIMLGWPGPEYQSPRRCGHVCQAVLVHVSDVDEHYLRTSSMGATIISEPETQPFGERSYELSDIEGQHWHFSQHVQDVAPEEWGAKVN